MFNFFKKLKKDKDTNLEVLRYKDDKYSIKDNYKAKEYFLNKLKNINNYLDRYNEKLKNEAANKSVGYIIINKFILQKIHILYVLNEDVMLIKELVEEYNHNLREYAKKEKLSYNDCVMGLSLGYLFNLEKEKIEFIKENMIDEKYIDAILDILRNKVFENKILNTKEFYFKEKGYFADEYVKSTSELINVINLDNIEERTNEFLKYLNDVKEKHYKILLKHYEELGDERYTYIGAYDFKITAIAKILEIEKDRLKDSKFIALDLI